MLDKIFDSFATSAANSDDAHRGVGLGLGIVKAIIEAHDGEIIALNNQKGGATFRFSLPLKEI